MKSTRLQARNASWIFIAFVVSSFQVLKAQNTSTSATHYKSMGLSGSDLRIEEATAKAAVIFVGKITNLGVQSDTDLYDADHLGVQAVALQFLRGSLDPKTTFTLHIYFPSGDSHEDVPVIGTPYICFVRKKDASDYDPYAIFKLLPATNANIAKVKALIAAAPTPK